MTTLFISFMYLLVLTLISVNAWAVFHLIKETKAQKQKRLALAKLSMQTANRKTVLNAYIIGQEKSTQEKINDKVAQYNTRRKARELAVLGIASVSTFAMTNTHARLPDIIVQEPIAICDPIPAIARPKIDNRHILYKAVSPDYCVQ